MTYLTLNALSMDALVVTVAVTVVVKLALKLVVFHKIAQRSGLIVYHQLD